MDGAVQVIDLPFSFNWRGEAEYTAVTVTLNGDIFLGNEVPYDQTYFDPQPLESWGQHSIARIAAAQSDIGPSGSIITAQIGDDAFIISWENVFQFCETSENAVNFQALLFKNGNVELRWGEGNPVYSAFAAGLEDDAAGVIVPATGGPFDSSIGGAGVSSQWPVNQCRSFVVSNGGYIEGQS